MQDNRLPKRIMLISHEMTYTGAPNSLLNMARVLRKHGHIVKIYTLLGGNFKKEFLKYGFSVKYLNIEELTQQKCITFSQKHDLAICNTIFCGRLACLLQDYLKTILLIREAENLPDIMRENRIDESCIRNAENMICVSEYAEKFIQKTYSPKRLWVLHNFLVTSSFHRPKLNKIRSGKIRFLIAATIEKRKGIDIAIDAVKLLPKSVSERVVLDIAGRKPEWSREYWSGLIPENDPRFLYHGEVTKGKKRLFKKANVLLVPSLDESCSLTALEGAMYGKALIVSQNVGAKYIADFVVETGNAEELSQAICFFVNNSDELITAGERAYKRFKETSTHKIYYNNLIKIFLEVCSGE